MMATQAAGVAPAGDYDHDAELARVLAGDGTAIHFQPIVALDRAGIFGWEALARGPSDSPLHSPLVLFDVALRLGRLIDVERTLLTLAVRRFRELGLPGQLFLNVTADALAESARRRARIIEVLRQAGVPPSRIVIELTETRAATDPASLAAALHDLRALGFVMAIDDLGEGFASLRRWSELRPEYVKIDRHFIDGIHRDALKQRFVRSIVDMAVHVGCTVIGEGVEEAADLHAMRQVGIPLIQGYLVARPALTPRPDLRADVMALLCVAPSSAMVGESRGSGITAGQLARRAATVTPATTCGEAIEMFAADDHLLSLPVVDDDARVLGTLRSMDVLKRGSERYFPELFGRKSCAHMMDAAPLMFDVDASLRTLSEVVANLNERHLVDGFIVTQQGRYFGSGHMTDLIKAVSDMQVFAARYANPLTMLPGNVPIDETINRQLAGGAGFVVAYFDLDHFKAFNDVYGYTAGDEVIRFTARMLAGAIEPDTDFLGHVGGDDFLVVFGSGDWERRVEQLLVEFDAGVGAFYRPEHRAAGGYITENRQGLVSFHPLISLSAGAVPVDGARFASAAEVSPVLAEAKKVAKGRVGSYCFVDRRLQPMRHKVAMAAT